MAIKSNFYGMKITFYLCIYITGPLYDELLPPVFDVENITLPYFIIYIDFVGVSDIFYFYKVKVLIISYSMSFLDGVSLDGYDNNSTF